MTAEICALRAPTVASRSGQSPIRHCSAGLPGKGSLINSRPMTAGSESKRSARAAAPWA